MSAPNYPNPTERLELTERELAIATLVGRYIERREHRASPRVHDLLAAAAEFGDSAVASCAACSPSTRRCAPARQTTDDASRGQLPLTGSSRRSCSGGLGERRASRHQRLLRLVPCDPRESFS